MKKTIIVTIALLILLVACSKPQTTTPTQENTPAAQPAQTQTTQAAPAAETKPSAPAAADSSMFKKFMTTRGSLEYQVAYDLASTAHGQNVAMKMTQYLKGSNKIRSDVKIQGIESRTFILDGKITSCTNMGSWKCISIKQNQDTVKDFEKNYAARPNDYTIVPDGTKTVAGTETTCFKVTKDETTVRYCFSKEGVPLYIQMNAPQATTEMTASSYSLSVPDSTFELPAQATEMTIPSAGSGSSDPCAMCQQAPENYRDQCLQNCKQ